MIFAHKIALIPNDKQRTYFAKAAGVARFAYNWALAEWKRQHEARKANPESPAPSQMALRRQLNAIKRERFPWMLEVTKCAPQMAIVQLGEAFKRFFARKARYPKPRKKGVDDRFSLSNDQFKAEGRKVRIPNLGWVRMAEGLRFQGKILSATVSRTACRWFVSIAVETEDKPMARPKAKAVVGVDLGITSMATLSTGEKIAGPKPRKRLLPRIKRLSRSLSRKKKGSANRRKARIRLAKCHARMAAARNDAIHKLTTSLVERFGTIVIEDLNVRGMMRNHHLAGAIGDMAFYEFRRQLEYKAAVRGVRVVVADRWCASSKTCHVCGHKKEELPLRVREWECPVCGARHDRDVNAAVNLRNLAGSSPATARGEDGSGRALVGGAKPASAKRESNRNLVVDKIL